MGKIFEGTCCLYLLVGEDYCTVLKMVAVTSSEKLVYQFTLSSSLSVCPPCSLLSFLCLHFPKLFFLSFFLSTYFLSFFLLSFFPSFFLSFFFSFFLRTIYVQDFRTRDPIDSLLIALNRKLDKISQACSLRSLRSQKRLPPGKLS
jgi:hypothetical protein